MSVRRYSNGTWKAITGLKRFSEGKWQSARLKRFDGEYWKTVWPQTATYTKTYSMSGYIVTRGHQNILRIDSDTLVTGNHYSLNSKFLHDSLMFFPIDKMKADLEGAVITDVSLKLTRVRATVNSGENIAYIFIGCALTGIDPASADAVWSRNYTLLRDEPVEITHSQTRNIPLSPSSVYQLLSGEIDCLCLPTTSEYFFNTAGYAEIKPSSVSLTVNYY